MLSISVFFEIVLQTDFLLLDYSMFHLWWYIQFHPSFKIKLAHISISACLKLLHLLRLRPKFLTRIASVTLS